MLRYVDWAWFGKLLCIASPSECWQTKHLQIRALINNSNSVIADQSIAELISINKTSAFKALNIHYYTSMIVSIPRKCWQIWERLTKLVYTNFIVRLNQVDSLAVLSLNGFTALEVSLIGFTAQRYKQNVWCGCFSQFIVTFAAGSRRGNGLCWGATRQQ